MGIVYAITYLEDGTEYVGQTTQDLSDRITQHVKTKSLLGTFIQKKGLEAFGIRVLAYCPRDQLNECERDWVERLGTLFPDGFNKTFGGSGASRPRGSRPSRAREYCNRGHWKGKPNKCLECARKRDRRRYRESEQRRENMRVRSRAAKDPCVCAECEGPRPKHAQFCVGCRELRRNRSQLAYYERNRETVIRRAAQSKKRRKVA